jgi:hypothetical protein
VSPSDPNRPGSEWRFEENILPEHPREGMVTLNILQDRRVGGVEFGNRL